MAIYILSLIVVSAMLVGVVAIVLQTSENQETWPEDVRLGRQRSSMMQQELAQMTRLLHRDVVANNDPFVVLATIQQLATNASRIHDSFRSKGAWARRVAQCVWRPRA